MSEKVERRFVSGGEIRAAAGDGLRLTGRAVTYGAKSLMNVPARNARETIAKGAFTASLKKGDDVVCNSNHDPSQLLGRTKNGTLTLEDTDDGLNFTVELNPAVQAHRDLHALVKARTMDSCSFEFAVDGVDGDEWTDDTDENGKRCQLRTVKRAKLFGVSVVTHPAYEGSTTAQARSADEWQALRERAAAMPGDWARQEKAHELSLMLAAEQRGMAEMSASRCIERDGNCADPECGCQNNFSEADDVYTGEDDADERSVRSSDDNVRTKSVGGKNLPASAFAFVGDPDKTETWKLPIHDASHVRNAMARFHQTEGIPLSQHKKVWNRILAAAKKFDIEVSATARMWVSLAEQR